MNFGHNLVSVTLSTYNVEGFIAESLESIIAQTFSSMEIICIDDGSTDKTPEILKSFSEKDKRIQLVLKDKNEGLAVSRNEALELAKGKYVTFLDGDDLYDKEMILKAYSLAEKESSDLVIWDYHVFWKPNELYNVGKLKSRLSDTNPKNKIQLLQKPAFTWVKLIRTEKAREIGIHFPKGRTRQDIPVHWHLITALDKINILPEKLSFYRQQPDATTAQKDRRVFDLAFVLDTTKDYLLKNDIYIKFKDEFLRQRLNLLFGMYDVIKPVYKKEAKKIIDDRLSVDEWAYINSKKTLRSQARYFYKSLEGDVLSLIHRNIWIFTRTLFRRIKR